MYTVKQVSDLAQISVRTLHYYDEIGLLKPAQVGENGYRYYDEAALLRLQSILFYRELGLELRQIQALLDEPRFDLRTTLEAQRQALSIQQERLSRLLATLDQTLKHIEGKERMNPQELFQPFSEEQQAYYTRLARLRYGPSLVDESVARWQSYDAARREAIIAEGRQIYLDLSALMQADHPPTSPAVQAGLGRWHEHLGNFYEPTLEILRGLGQTYEEDPQFRAYFEAIHADLPAYLHQAIVQYVDGLETAILEQMEAEDAAKRLAKG